MKLVSLYSNQENIFPAIEFQESFNVVFARVKDLTIRERDSHNLGKTFLIQIIDFGLLSKIEKNHPFKANIDLFGNFVFYLELQTNSGEYVTVRRRVRGHKAVSIHVDMVRGKRLTDLPHSEWTYPSMGFDKARQTLDELLGLDAIKSHYTYRKGVGYSLRQQSDYDDEFRISSRFGRSKDRDWKPYIALVLGFDPELLLQKYDLDQEIAERSKYCKRLEDEAGSRSEEYDEIRGRIEISEGAMDKLRQDLDEFSFREIEAEINAEVVSRIERRIVELNEARYTIDYELQEIERSLKSEHAFDVEEIEEIFREVQLFLPDALIRDYRELIEFNRRLSSERSERLRELRKRLIIQRGEIDTELNLLDSERQDALAILQEMETLKKYRELQAHLHQHEQRLFELRQQLAYLDRATAVQGEIEELKRERDDIVNQIREALRSENSTYSAIRRTFSDCVEEVLNVKALLSVKVNRQGNLEFKTQTIDRLIAERRTSEGLGTSYKKLLCACWDITILSVYTSGSFYRFVYHDGIFEGLDNRIKVSLLGLIRRICDEKGIQYILTVIDSDLPRDERDQKLLFTEDEIVRELHDEGDQGRLFRMRAF